MQVRRTYFSNQVAHFMCNLNSIYTFDGTHLIGAVKPNTKAFKQNNLKSAQLLSLEGAQTGEKTKDDKCQEYRRVCRQ